MGAWVGWILIFNFIYLNFILKFSEAAKTRNLNFNILRIFIPEDI
jgi:hypothetical protein